MEIISRFSTIELNALPWFLHLPISDLQYLNNGKSNLVTYFRSHVFKLVLTAKCSEKLSYRIDDKNDNI